jgi:hypothetical protein
MNKEETLIEIEREWQQFLDVAGGFSAEKQTTPGVVGHWNVRESLLHVAAWNGEQVTILATYLSKGEERDYGDDEAVDRLNEDQVDEKRELTLDQVWAHLHQTHQVLLVYISGLAEDAFRPDSYTGETIAMESFCHYKEHREDIERFKASGQ